jgi:plastocyanin
LRKLLVLALIVGVSAILATQALAAGTRSVKVGDNYYVRPSGVPTVTVRKGTKVVWRFQGHSVHTVVVSSGPTKFRSSARSSGTFAKTLTKRGTYRIFCSIHGAADQSMKLVVK